MKSFKIDVRSLGSDPKLKQMLVDKLHELGYCGESNIGFYSFIYCNGYAGENGCSLSFGNKPKTFSKNRFEELSWESAVNLTKESIKD